MVLKSVAGVLEKWQRGQGVRRKREHGDGIQGIYGEVTGGHVRVLALALSKKAGQ